MSEKAVAGSSRSRGVAEGIRETRRELVEPFEDRASNGSDSDTATESSGNGSTSFNSWDNNLSSYVLASIMKRGIMSVSEIKATVDRASVFFKFPVQSNCSTTESIVSIVQQINRDICKYNMILRSVHCEITGRKYYTVRVDRHSAMTKFQTEFKKPEIAIINECIQSMLYKNETLSIPFRECLTIVRKHTKTHYTYAEGKKFYRKLINLAYFAITGDSENEENDDEQSLTLGSRALEEFLGVLQENYPDLLKSCKICSQPMLHGYECPLCGVSTHRHCCEAYVKESQVCPGNRCNGRWNNVSSLTRRTFQSKIIQTQSTRGDATATTASAEEEMN
ncbi:unnamed protein product [Allacma fusca]|uniref:Non-structural maintenance of chromosomes element 1 homolog n=1 Tax=Allacma fusca TaxID=39272 RepID=A0A8J2L940_9HEXA|nr:unnamed protein product [Allacma fusca]